MKPLPLDCGIRSDNKITRNTGQESREHRLGTHVSQWLLPSHLRSLEKYRFPRLNPSTGNLKIQGRAQESVLYGYPRGFYSSFTQGKVMNFCRDPQSHPNGWRRPWSPGDISTSSNKFVSALLQLELDSVTAVKKNLD